MEGHLTFNISPALGLTIIVDFSVHAVAVICLTGLLFVYGRWLNSTPGFHCEPEGVCFATHRNFVIGEQLVDLSSAVVSSAWQWGRLFGLW